MILFVNLVIGKCTLILEMAVIKITILNKMIRMDVNLVYYQLVRQRQHILVLFTLKLKW